jgi:Possible hemagglutinin (DUF637)
MHVYAAWCSAPVRMNAASINTGSVLIPADNTIQITSSRVNIQTGSNPQQTLTQLAQQPGMGWVSDVVRQQQEAQRNNPGYTLHLQNVQLAHNQWDYKKQGLTQEGAAIVTLVVAFLSYGAASSAGSAVAGGAGMTTTTVTAAGVTTTTLTAAGTVVAAATAAAVTTLATQATISLINNQGNLGATLKELGSKDSIKNLAMAMVTAGALSGVNLAMANAGITTTAWNSINATSPFIDQLQKNLVNNLTSTVVQTALTGGNSADYERGLQNSILTALITTGAAQGANAIGDMATGPNSPLNAFTHKIAHAIAGCAAGAATASVAGGNAGTGCGSGAIGAVIGEITAQMMGSNMKPEDLVNLSKLMGGVAAALTGGNIAIAAVAGGNAAENNYVTHSPFRDVRAAVTKENARLTSACGANCSLDEMRKIDLQMQQLETVGNLAVISQRTGLTTAQAVQMGEMLATLLPVYGSPIALYQAISGQSLTGNDLTTTERFFNGIAGAIPAGSAAYKLISSAMAELRIAASAGGIAADGKALMDFSQLSKAQKGVVGELLGADTVKIAMPGAQRLGRLGDVGSQGIDDLYKVTTANVDYVIVEYKFGTSPLGKTVDGVQMSDGWVAGGERVLNAVGGNPAQAASINKAIEAGRIEKWVVHTDPAGGTSIWIVDAAGKYIKAGSDVVSRVLGVKK